MVQANGVVVSAWRTTVNAPRGLVVSAQGVLYVASATAALGLMQLNATGGVTTGLFTGATSAIGVAIDSYGALWVADYSGGALYQVQLNCTVPAAPLNGALGNCSLGLNSGLSCQMTCNAGYTLMGAATTCTSGSVTPQTCVSASAACAIGAPVNGVLGACNTTLASGSTCVGTCNSGYQSSGAFACTGGVLTSTQSCLLVGTALSGLVTGYTSSLTGLAVDLSGNVYVGVISSNYLLKISAGGLLGAAAVVTSGLNAPYNVGADPVTGAVFVSHRQRGSHMAQRPVVAGRCVRRRAEQRVRVQRRHDVRVEGQQQRIGGEQQFRRHGALWQCELVQRPCGRRCPQPLRGDQQRLHRRRGQNRVQRRGDRIVVDSADQPTRLGDELARRIVCVQC
jgi:hypothetical protein